MTEKQKRFCLEYLKDPNATQAAIKAGYSKKTAGVIGDENLKKPNIKNFIQKELDKMEEAAISDASEVMKYLTSVMRGQTEGEEIVTEFIGDGMSEARRMKKKPSEKDKLKAAELLGKRFGLFKDSVTLDSDSELTIHIDYGDDPE